MNKQELVEAVAKELGTSKAGGERAVSAVLCGIAKGVKKDKNVQLIGFGTFSVKKRKARPLLFGLVCRLSRWREFFISIVSQQGIHDKTQSVFRSRNRCNYRKDPTVNE